MFDFYYRHAVWALKGAPPAPPTPPLWERSRYWRSSRCADSHIGVLDQDAEDMELLGVVDANYDGPTRDEALADALGVRRTPRQSSEMTGRATTRPKSMEAVSTAPGNPMGQPLGTNDASVMEMETGPTTIPSQLLNLRPMSNLHPTVALECLYEEHNQSLPATNVFLASNVEGSGVLVLCLVCPTSSGEENKNILSLLSIIPTLSDPMSHSSTSLVTGTLSESLSHHYTVKHLSSKPCVAAQPIQSIPTPICFLPSTKLREKGERNRSTDILILQRRNDGEIGLSLNRADLHVVDCALLHEDDVEGMNSFITDVRNPVGNNIDFVTTDCLTRGNISLVLDSSCLAEKALAAIDATMYSHSVREATRDAIEFALKFRADCCRLNQALNSQTLGPGAFLLVNNMGWTCLESIVVALTNLELFGEDVNAKVVAPEKLSQKDKSAWERLLNSSFHASYSIDNSDTAFLGRQNDDSSLPEADRERQQDLLSSVGCQIVNCSSPKFLCQVFDSLHFVYEDLKLHTDGNRSDQLRSVGNVLAYISHAASFVGPSRRKGHDNNEKTALFIDHYTRDLGRAWMNKLQDSVSGKHVTLRKGPQFTTFPNPPCILSWLDAVIKKKPPKPFVYDAQAIHSVNAACTRTRSIIRIFAKLFCSTADRCRKAHDVVKALAEEGFSSLSQVRDELPTGIALPLLELLHLTRDDPDLNTTNDWTADELTLVGRDDLSKNAMGNGIPVPVQVPGRDSSSFDDHDEDGIAPLELSSSMLFPDNRIREAGRLLRSSRPIFLSVKRAIEVTDHEYERLKQNKLLLLSRRALALSVGRGMLTLGSFHPVAAEPLPVPDLTLVGRIPPTNATLALDVSDCPSDMKVWPEVSLQMHKTVYIRITVYFELSDSICLIIYLFIYLHIRFIVPQWCWSWTTASFRR